MSRPYCDADGMMHLSRSQYARDQLEMARKMANVGSSRALIGVSSMALGFVGTFIFFKMMNGSSIVSRFLSPVDEHK